MLLPEAHIAIKPNPMVYHLNLSLPLLPPTPKLWTYIFFEFKKKKEQEKKNFVTYIFLERYHSQSFPITNGFILINIPLSKRRLGPPSEHKFQNRTRKNTRETIFGVILMQIYLRFLGFFCSVVLGGLIRVSQDTFTYNERLGSPGEGGYRYKRLAFCAFQENDLTFLFLSI